MSNLKKIIISISSFSLGIAIIVYFRGDKNKSVKENVQDNLHLVNQYVDQGKEKVKKLLKNEEDIFLIDNSAFPFVLFFVFFVVGLFLFCDDCEKYFVNNYTGSMISDLWKLIKNNHRLTLWRAVFGVCLEWFIVEGIITSTIYSIICLIKKKPLKYAFDHRFYFRSWKNFFLFVGYSFVIDFIFVKCCDDVKYIIGSFYYLGKKDEKEQIAENNKLKIISLAQERNNFRKFMSCIY